MMAGQRSLLTGLVLWWTLVTVDSMQCLSIAGKPVDWYVVYKLPILSKSLNPIMSRGLGFYYLDVDSPTWILSKVGIDGKVANPVYNTLQQIYSSSKNGSYMYAMYNDQTPSSESLNHGHTKGVLSFDTQEGFWLVHSTPHFPPNRTMGWAWPDSAMDYGQAFLCVSYPIAMMEKIGEQFLYTYPKIYDKNFPASFAAKSPVMNQILGDKQSHVKQLPWYHKTTLVSKAGHNFVSYAKFGKFMADLYDNLVAIDLQSDMMVETWQKGGVKENLPTNCSIQYKVYNVENVTFPVGGVYFLETKDHSKWAVSVDKGGWTCIGDINRQRSQFHRAGGTVCFQQKQVWKSFRALVGKYAPCPKENWWN
ncbi:deoxyribonuclease-2-alpha-like isoform X2 [Mizuhopecten yessoensis]|uniref:deoxyribonuclease-2-alpha-like isoform X2 n=1 Tax=Mizuhopecten yessoensis TaxID=6573 RepID=UPI000B45DA30|nr:deoxyribonuclease-2-alpha-like isoform X2 [Mizuhopecten yessoensis]